MLWSERRVAALCELVAALVLFVLVTVALVQFLDFSSGPVVDARRFAIIPAGLLLGALFAAHRTRRALRRLRSGPEE